MPEKFKVVISGISGRFPDSGDVDTFKTNLYNGHDFVTTDDRKWPVGYRHELFEDKQIPDPTGKLPVDHKKCDSIVFKLSASWAEGYDILNGLILEPSFEAIVDAGINPYSLDGCNVGVFMSSTCNDVERCFFTNEIPNQFALIGLSRCMMANRISYFLNLTGPSFTNQSELHGGLNTLAMAYKYVSQGSGEAAIVGAASSILNPRISLLHIQLGILSPDGITRPFDEWANGYARSESVVCFYLQRAEDAKRNYGEIIFCDSSYLGSELPSLVGYNEEYLKMAWHHLIEVNKSIFDPSDIAFVEMSAFGHRFADEIESNAVAEWFSKNKKNPLMVGSVKSNVGHTEAVAGLMSVLKALLALDSGIVSSNLNLKNLNSHIKAFQEDRLQVVTENIPLPGKVIAVNSCGLLGTVGLAVIQQHENLVQLPRDRVCPRILLLSGREEVKLLSKLKRIANMPCTLEFISLANDSFQQNMPLHLYRGFTLLPTVHQPIIDVGEKGEINRPVWFIFTGMGSQWNGMGKDLLNLPLFAKTVAKCDRVLRTKNIDIYKILTSDDPTLFDDITNAFVGIITVQIGLHEVLKALGIEPDGIIGHSAGENGCAYADGCVTLEEAVLVSWARGKASMEVKTIKGMMAAVGESYAKIKYELPEDIEVACHNSRDNCSISGPAESVNTYVKTLQEKGVFAKPVNVASIAYHSRYIKPIASELIRLLKPIVKTPKKRSSKWISTAYPEHEWNLSSAQYFTPEYATNNLLNPVFFEEGCKHIPENAICIEIAPHGLLQAILKRSLPPTCTHIPLTNRTQNKVNNLNFLLSGIGKLYIAGLEPQVNNIFPKVEYPVPRGTPSLSPYCTWHHSDDPLPRHVLSTTHVDANSARSNQQIPVCVRYDSDYVYLEDHRIHGNITIPPSFFMYLTWKAFSFVRNEELGSSSIIFEDVKICNHVIVKRQDLKYASVMIQYGTGNFEVILRDQEDSEDFQVILTGSINLMLEKTMNSPHSSVNRNTEDVIPKSHFYYIFKRAGYSLGGEFCLINDLQHHDTGYETTVTWNGNWVAFLDALMKFQMFANHEKNVGGVFPYRLRRLEILANRFSSLKCGTALTCTIDTTTNELFCDGMRMHALEYEHRMLSEPEIKRLHAFQFVPYEKPQCQNIHQFLNLSLQIAVESADSLNELVVLDLTMQYSKIIEQIIDEPDFPKSVTVLHSEKEFSHASGGKPTFIVTDIIEDLARLESFTTNELILYISPLDFSFHGRDEMKKGFIEITKQSFSANTFRLLKRNFSEDSHKQAELYFFGDWKEEMNSKLNGIIDETKPYFVVRNDIEFEDISTIVKRKKPHLNARYLFILDEVQCGEKLNQLIQKQMSMDLPVSIFQHGEWGSYRDITLNYDDVEDGHHLPDINTGLEEMNYICMYHGKLWSKEFCGVSFATCVNNVVERIGLAQISETGKLSRDQYLSWVAPSYWSLEEAVMVPYFYAQAYNLLYPFCRNRRIDTVMINIGTEYFLAEAVIALALYTNQTVFVTVSNDDEAVLLQNKFPKLCSQHIFRTPNYEAQIRTKMKGEGVQLVINCLPGIQHVDACLRCVGRFGVYTEVGMANCSDLLNAGLYDFLKCISVRVIQNRVADLLKLPVDTKIRMKMFLEECIKEGAVVPPRITQGSILSTVSPTPLDVIKCHSATEVISTGPRLLRYDKSNSYMIVGTTIEDGSWFDLLEWLILQGAQKFTIALEEYSLPPTDHPIHRILCQKNLQILFISASKLEDKRKTSSIIKGTEKFGSLEAIFFVSIKIVGKKLSNLDSLVSPSVHFVGLFSNGLKEFEHRKAKGSPAILIHYDDTIEDLSLILPQLNELLFQIDCNNNAGVLYHATYATSNENRSVSTSRQNLRDYFPYDFESLARIGQEEAVGFGFVEMCSLSRKYAHCKDVYPIFILPSVHRVTLLPLIEHLLQPVFTATSAPIPSIKCAAHGLYKSLIKIQRLGPITIVSETWTLPLALELASHARSNDRKYRIFVLEGNPKMWSEQAARLHQASKSKRSKTTYADEILHFGNDEIDAENFSRKYLPLEDKVKMFARNEGNDVRFVENVVRGGKLVQTKLGELTQMHFTDGLLENVTFIERYQPDNGVFDNLSTTSKIIVLNEPSYKDLLMNRNVSQIINENALFSWWVHAGSDQIR